jgi:putative N6-adenine-specific DNA methylase
MKQLDFFATTAKGLEDLLADELLALECTGVNSANGGVYFQGSIYDGYRACLWLRTANRVLMPVANFSCPSQEALFENTYALPWETYLTPNMTLAVDANLRDSALTHSRFAALKTKDAIVDRIRERCGQRPNVNPKDPDLRINVHIAKNQCTVSLDLAGTGLHRRGYRRDPTVAPLKETLAAGLVAMTGWDRQTHFVDPMCGSGSLPVEAALLASNTAPGLLSPNFGFQRWLDFDASVWQELLEEAKQDQQLIPDNLIFGSDRERKAVELARRNAESSGVGKKVRWSQHDFAKLEPPAAKGTLICNPPYGERIGEEAKLEAFYGKIGDTLKQNWKGWTAWVFTGNLPLSKRIGLKPSRRIVLFNGPIECRLLKYELY